MKNAYIFTIILFCSLLLFGCQDDSDYLIGRYDVAIVTELSSCGDEIFAFSVPYYLPTSHVTGSQVHMNWRIVRVGITGTGAEKIQLDILSEGDDSVLLDLSGTLEQPWLHMETSKPLTSDSCEIKRVITLSGQLEYPYFTGTIQTTLASVRQSATCEHQLPPNLICSVTETFVAIQRPPQ